jgi:membrane-associated protein
MMSSVNITTLQNIADTLGHYDRLAYIILFLGAFFETLIPFSLLVMGELFFLAGALLAGMQVLDVRLVVIVLCVGGILGDNTSYWLGRNFGEGFFAILPRLPFIKKPVLDGIFHRGMEFFERRGAVAVFAGRLSGPLSWVTPAMAGMFRLDYKTFLRFNTLGVVIGIGQFLVAGYYFGSFLPEIIVSVGRWSPYLFFLLFATLGLTIAYRQAK